MPTESVSASSAPDLISMAIPVFFILILVEIVVGIIARRDFYRLNDSINDLSMGTFDSVIGAFLKTAIFSIGYYPIYTYHSLFEISTDSILMWGLCLLAYDFLYYWAHRASHEINALWGSHIAHHSSEEYNLSVALRQGALQRGFFWIFYLPLAMIGFPPVMFIVMAQVDTLYQFWIHTRAVGKLGPIEWFMNTPSHHRVHHGQNAKYIDKNHAGVLIIWDRMFGTFQVEEEEPVYGIVSPLRSWNPVWGQIHYWVYLAKLSWNAPRWRDKVLVWFMPPAWKPKGLETPPRKNRPNRREEQERYNPKTPLGVSLYVLAQYIVTTPAIVLFLAQQGAMSSLEKAVYAGFILGTLVCLGGLLELKRWARYVESIRVLGYGAVLSLMAYRGHDVMGVNGIALYSIAAVHTAVFAPWLLAYARSLVNPPGPLPEETEAAIAEDLAPAK